MLWRIDSTAKIKCPANYLRNWFRHLRPWTLVTEFLTNDPVLSLITCQQNRSYHEWARVTPAVSLRKGEWLLLLICLKNKSWLEMCVTQGFNLIQWPIASCFSLKSVSVLSVFLGRVRKHKIWEDIQAGAWAPPPPFPNVGTKSEEKRRWNESSKGHFCYSLL